MSSSPLALFLKSRTPQIALILMTMIWGGTFVIVHYALNYSSPMFFVYLSCAKGDAGTNNYGAPRITRGWEKVLAWIYIVIFPISILILAVTAIPAYQSYLDQAQQFQQYQQQINQSE